MPQPGQITLQPNDKENKQADIIAEERIQADRKRQVQMKQPAEEKHSRDYGKQDKKQRRNQDKLGKF